ncbi:hypothetical protein [Streptomyces acidicola]|uniref:hypothetical protein n=1 Tax=Streptomyces acidicola TaxID=2596892 RepID=UPI002AD53449|nr:hypothetical protein [Streptomyces acidicola]
MEIVDDGRGATEDGPAHGFGIVGMRERSLCCTAASASGRAPRAASGWRRGCPCPTSP